MLYKVNESGKVTFLQAWKDLWKGYFDFKGISTRAGFWWAILFCLIELKILDFLIKIVNGEMIMFYILFIIITIPILTAALRRFRDAGLNENLIAILFIAYILIQVLLNANIISIWLPFFYNVTMMIILCMPTGKFKTN